MSCCCQYECSCREVLITTSSTTTTTLCPDAIVCDSAIDLGCVVYSGCNDDCPQVETGQPLENVFFNMFQMVIDICHAVPITTTSTTTTSTSSTSTTTSTSTSTTTTTEIPVTSTTTIPATTSTSTSTTTTTTCVTPTGTTQPFYSSADYSGIGDYFDFTFSQAAACAAMNMGDHNYSGPSGVYQGTLDIGTVVYNSAYTDCTVIPTGYYVILDLILGWQIVYIVDGVVDSFPACSTVVFTPLDFGYSPANETLACGVTPIPGYYSNCGINISLGIGCVIYTDPGGPVYVPDGYYSDGTNVYTVSGGYGLITAIQKCL